MKQQALRDKLGELDYMVYRTGDIRNEDRLNQICNGIDIIIHAAAMKHIQNCEDEPDEALLTNVIGTRNVYKAALRCNVNKTILISTDKAVEPITYYGHTKAMAEGLILGGNKYKSSNDIRFSVCRYGNVIGSAGSIIPYFKELIAKGVKELPITNEQCTRFFLPMKTAVEFVLKCIDNMQGGEIFIPPDLPSARIVYIAKAFDMPYKIIGMRGIEKMHEKLCDGYDSEFNKRFLNIEEIRGLINEA
jgi:UDP-N-acetylglucosamine 4,6-dehydratase